MAEKLYVEFGGLCMLVQKTIGDADTHGLFALMPVMEMAGQSHCQYMVTGILDTGAGRTPAVAGITGDVIDLRAYGDNTTVSGLTVDNYAQISHYADSVVQASFLTDDAPQWPLAASVILPTGAEEQQVGFPKARLIVPKSGAVKQLVGRVLFAFDIDDGAVAELTTNGINGIPVERDHLGHLKVWFLNIRPKDFGLHHYAHAQGPAVHLRAYYDLLDRKPNPIPDLICPSSIPGDPDNDDYTECADRIIEKWPPPVDAVMIESGVSVFFVDPYNCTIGTGCEEPC